MVICRECGAEVNNESAIYCPKCGNKMQENAQTFKPKRTLSDLFMLSLKGIFFWFMLTIFLFALLSVVTGGVGGIWIIIASPIISIIVVYFLLRGDWI